MCSCSRVENREKSELWEENERYGRIFIEEEEKQEEVEKKKLNIAMQHSTHSNNAIAM